MNDTFVSVLNGKPYRVCKHGKIPIKDENISSVSVISDEDFIKIPLLPDYPRLKCIDCANTSIIPNVIIYVLCHNEDRLDFAKYAYGNIPWAKPILMKYQDVTFENAFLKQLLEISEEWCDCEMVGFVSANAVNKMDFNTVVAAVQDRQKWNTGYCNFFRSERKLLHDIHHPHIQEIIKDIKEELGLKLTIQAYYANYWMCTPYAMKRFIEWSHDKLIPAVLKHKYAFINSKYGKPYLTKKQCIALCGFPYYPNVPFILERLNACFFSTYFKDLIL